MPCEPVRSPSVSEVTYAVRSSKPMRLRILVALTLAAASCCPRSAAQTNGPTPGTVVSWGGLMMPNVQPGTRYQGIAAGASHSLALKPDGTVLAWGDNFYEESTVPASLTGVVAIAAGGNHSLAIEADGTVV